VEISPTPHLFIPKVPLRLPSLQTGASSSHRQAESSSHILPGFHSHWGMLFLQWQVPDHDCPLDKYAILPEYPEREVPGKTAGSSLPVQYHPVLYATGKSTGYPS